MNQVVLITGASSGIGLVTAKFLASKGYKVYGTARRQMQSNEFVFMQADVTNHEQMQSVFKFIYDTEGRIDAVINNAGMGISGAIEYTSKIDIENIFNTNVIAVIDICSLAIPYLRKSKGKIVNISSVAAPISIPFQACYSATKSAIESFSSALYGEVKDFGIKVTCIRPGDTKTGFTGARVKSEITTDEFYGERIKNSVEKMERDEQKGMDSICVSKLIYKTIKRKNPAPIKTVGFGYKFLCFLTKILPARFINWVVKKIYG